ncbi:MAG: FtsK/SpoIIIE domain-containing protein [Dehalococcoidales bacterium]|nr:FtsK/SpoIIIE domain-containing protein [Dehalococcoidales bacterium]
MEIRLSHVQAAAITAIAGGGMLALYPPALLFSAGMACAGIAAYGLLDRPKSNTGKVREVFEAVSYRNKNDKYPVKLNKNKSDTHLVYELPPGRCPEEFEKLQPYLNSHLKAETEIYSNNGQLHIKVMADKLPGKLNYTNTPPPEGMILPIPIGQSRAGFIWADLTELPHLVVAGETYGGKSNFLHQAIASLVRQENVELYVIDLKKVEFGYLKDHAEIALALPDAVRVLETLSLEMIRRMDLLLTKRIPKIQEYRHDGSLPYIVLVIDELSQLSPALAKDAGVKALRTIALQYLTDILCLARALGIHVIVSTQRPDKDILPGQLKANVPAALCFKVKNDTNSRIVLDNNKADQLPRIKGRAVWQFDVEREVQVQYLPVAAARRLLPQGPLTKPVQLEPSFDGRV